MKFKIKGKTFCKLFKNIGGGLKEKPFCVTRWKSAG